MFGTTVIGSGPMMYRVPAVATPEIFIKGGYIPRSLLGDIAYRFSLQKRLQFENFRTIHTLIFDQSVSR